MKKMLACVAVMAVLTVCAQAQVTDPVEKELGFKSLFNGKDLDGWIDGNNQYEVLDDGTIRCKPRGGGNLYTKDRFANYIFRFDFKLTPNANNGVGIRTELVGEPSFTVGKEIQILDDSGSDYTNLAPYQYHGSIYGVVPAKRGSLRPVGEWNTMEILCDGTRIKVTVNAQVIVDAKVDEITEFMDKHDHPGLLKNDGHLAFLGHASEVWFRNLRILPLTHFGQGEKVLEQEKEAG
ncbi:MAG: DUF1080 domain-containing protein [Planctomycetaceae bacterium]|nr:DUF1080 domain-containing protein [Planctomycetaceae bacterium]